MQVPSRLGYPSLIGNLSRLTPTIYLNQGMELPTSISAAYSPLSARLPTFYFPSFVSYPSVTPTEKVTKVVHSQSTPQEVKFLNNLLFLIDERYSNNTK